MRQYKKGSNFNKKVINMELKINYQYTYFIHPFVVKQKKYQKYILRLLKDENCKLKRFEKEKDLRLYKHFTPKMRDFLF